ncbi:hypothetical protein ACIRPU_35245 [Streptomyces sp. NPDC102259]|uniref:hypothetical protein n=1 Tax=Streptomyces sp. NPDC102259 TaxID=3366148 RepID=UPI0038029A2C
MRIFTSGPRPLKETRAYRAAPRFSGERLPSPGSFPHGAHRPRPPPSPPLPPGLAGGRGPRVLAARRLSGHLLAAHLLAGHLLAGPIGAGLVLSAVSHTCGMGALLARPPHNRPPGQSPSSEETWVRPTPGVW